MYEDPPDGRAGPARRGEREKKTGPHGLKFPFPSTGTCSLVSGSAVARPVAVPSRHRGSRRRLALGDSASRRRAREVAPRAVGPDGTRLSGHGRQPSLGPAPRDRTGRRADAATRRSNA